MNYLVDHILKPIGLDDPSKINEIRDFDSDFPTLKLIRRNTIINKYSYYMLYDIETGKYIDTLLPWFRYYHEITENIKDNSYKGYEHAIYNKKDKIITYAVCDTSTSKRIFTIENYKISYQDKIFKCELVGKYTSPNTNFSVLPSTANYILYNTVAPETFPINVPSSDVVILNGSTLEVIRQFDDVVLNVIKEPLKETLFPETDYEQTFILNNIIALETLNDLPDITFYNYKTNKIICKIYNKAKIEPNILNTRTDNGVWIRTKYQMKYSLRKDTTGIPFIKISNNNKCKYINIMNDTKLEDQCSVCLEYTPRTKSLVPCGHSLFCIECIQSFKECPLCRKKIELIIPRY